MDERTKIYNILNTAANRGYPIDLSKIDDLLVDNRYYSIIFDENFLKTLWGDQWAYQAMKLARESDKLDYLSKLLSTDLLTREDIKNIFNTSLNDNHGSFLTSFAHAVVSSDSENFEILRSAAFQLLNKYNLERKI